MNPAYPILFLALLLVGWGIFWQRYPDHGQTKWTYREYTSDPMDSEKPKYEAWLRIYHYWLDTLDTRYNPNPEIYYFDYWASPRLKRDSILTKHGIK